MKKLSKHKRDRDVLRGLLLRRSYKKPKCVEKPYYNSGESQYRTNDNRWLKDNLKKGLDYEIIGKNGVVLKLPEKMNFSNDYEITTIYINAIRRLSKNRSNRSYRLARVNLDHLREISTPAALSLTAELTRWDDEVDNTLKPASENWSPIIFNQLQQLGFCDLFGGRSNSFVNKSLEYNNQSNNPRIIRYIKGVCNSEEKTDLFKRSLIEIVGGIYISGYFLMLGFQKQLQM